MSSRGTQNIDTLKTRIIQPVSAQGNVTVIGDLNVMGEVVSTGNTTSTKIIFEQGIVIGNSVTSALGGPGAISIGKGATASGTYGITIGTSSIASVDNAIAIGHNASSSGTWGIAIGHKASATVTKAVAIGIFSSAVDHGISLGMNTSAAARGVALGMFSKTQGLRCISIGYSAGPLSTNATGQYNIAIGRNTLSALNASSAIYNVAMGHRVGSSLTSGKNNTFLGQKAGDLITTGEYNVCIGDYSGGASASANVIAIGTSSIASGTSGVAIGHGTNASGIESTALGAFASTTGQRAIAIGGAYNATYSATAAAAGIAIGYHSVGGAYGVSIGNSAITRGQGCFSLGYQSGPRNILGTGKSNIAIGRVSLNSINDPAATYNTGIGYNAGKFITSGSQNTCIGQKAGLTVTTGNVNVCIGSFADCSSDTNYAIAIGYNSVATGDASAVIGRDITSRVADEFTTRGNRVVRSEVTTINAVSSTVTYPFTGTSTDISFFDIYVAARDASASTDAVMFSFKDGGVINKADVLTIVNPTKIELRNDPGVTTDVTVTDVDANLVVTCVGTAGVTLDWTVIIDLHPIFLV
jgi:hypothetical protein